MSWGELPGRLGRLADVFRRERLSKRTADFISGEMGRFMAEWKGSRSLSAQLMPLPLPRDQALHPVGCQLQDCYLNFHFEASPDSETPKCADFQLEVVGLLAAGECVIEMQDHWRIDSEPIWSNSHGVTEGREPHPSFHFQRGGHAQDEFARAEGFVPGAHTPLVKGPWKSLMQYPGPRIASLPFDPVLAIDFCIAQNDGPLWRRLRAIPEYFSLIEEAQKRIWEPFLLALAQSEARRRWLGPIIVV